METLDKIKDVIIDQLGVAKHQIDLTTNIITDLGADSLDQIELIMGFEEEFDIDIQDYEVENCQTVQDILTLVESKI